MTTPQNSSSCGEQIAYLRKGAAEIIREEDLARQARSVGKVRQAAALKLAWTRPRPDLHLGHTVVLRKLKHFQDLGHTGDFFWSAISPPWLAILPASPKRARPLTPEQVDANAKTYLDRFTKFSSKETRRSVQL